MISSIAVVLFSTALATAPCASLKSVSLPNTTITMAESVPAGNFTPPGGGSGGQRGGAPAGLQVPAFCRIAATLKPSADSEISLEVWLPENWNGKFEFVGGGGWAGVISYPALASALQEGYATASTDTGHKGGAANFAIEHPEKLVDFAYRAVHESTVKSKAIMMTFYDRLPKYSYWNGCSTGGRQGLMEAQRYPEDFDAIVAGAPANYQTHLHTWDLSVAVPVLKDPAQVVPAAKAAMLNKAVLAACDEKDKVKDGLLTNPRSCKFDPAVLLCKAGESENCLTAPQLDAVKRMYAPAKTKSGEVVFPGKEFGSETGWNAIAGGQAPQAVSLGSFLVAYDNANWDWKTFDLDRDLKMVDEKVGNIVNAINPDLSAFKARGGKLILYHGWNDTAISPGNTINYYSSVLSKMGAKQDNWIRLFMIPGMGHCQGGPGPSQVNYMGALERWRESGLAPDQMQAYHVTNNRVDMARPLCPYPQAAQYKGVGSTNDAANFVCRAPQSNAN
ncbi:MAG TPA: tannase/feruloyl esterase family alpha/beta hydrolase [Terriglobia bacterium]|jgi:feruloyl esterase